METVGERVRKEREAQKLSRPDLARKTGIGYSTIAELERGGMQTSTRLHVIADALGVSVKWLETGRGPKEGLGVIAEPDWSDVRGFAQAVGLGKGIEAQEYAETHKLKFRAEALAGQNLRPDKLAVMYGQGDSMLPRVHDGDAILFDTSDTRPRDGALFVIQVHGIAAREYQVKRAMILDDILYFVADNPAGEHGWKKPRRADAKRGHIDIIGRVRWIGSWEG